MRLGLIGYPLDHSLSAPMQRAALQTVGLDWTYETLPVAAEGLPGQVEAIRASDWRGINVTLPHKSSILPLVDDLDLSARAVGAVNCIVNDGGRLMGTNTDVPALGAELDKLLGDMSGRPAWVLGAGGAARACVLALLLRQAEVTIVCRRPEQGLLLAQSLSQQAGTAAHVRPWSLSTLSGAPSGSLIVNATPLGMWPETQLSPWPGRLDLPAGAVVFDLVYNPPVTRLIAQAQAAGLQAVNGAGMLVEQGALSFERWTGVAAPRRVMRDALERSMEAADAQISHGR